MAAQGRKTDFSDFMWRWLAPGAEPALDELLADPLLHLVMRRDGVTMAELCNRIAEARSRFGLGRFNGGPCRHAA